MGNDKRLKISCLKVIFLVVFVLAVMIPAGPARAASRNTWISNRGYDYYRDGKGKIVTGVKVIKKKCYLFDAKGRQLHGWRKVGSRYFFFRFGSGKNGYMVTSKKVNGLKLKADGSASVNTEAKKLKAKTLAGYSEWTDSFILPTMTYKQKLFACLDQLRRFNYKGEGDTILQTKNWETVCAWEMLSRRNKDRLANCYRFAGAFAYLANAIGYTDIQVCAFVGHGWAVINGNIFDPTYTIRLGTRYFPVPADKKSLYDAVYVRDLRKL